MPNPPVPKLHYDQFIARLVANAVRAIETQTGRKVESLSFPPPSGFDNAECNKSICVKFVTDAE